VPSRTLIIAILAIFPWLATAVAVSPAGGNMDSGDATSQDSRVFSVDKDDFENRRLAWSYFQALAERQDVLIIDVRSGFLPGGIPPGLNNVRPIPLEIFLANFVARKVHQDMTLLIFDESGHELHRLQFNLQKHGYVDYFFLEGGAEGALGSPRDRI
jgi:rhodanese-related sulfurtransferase